MVEFKAEVAPASPTIGALEYAAATRPRVECCRHLRVDGQSGHTHGGVGGAPASTIVRALEDTGIRPRVECCRHLRVDGQSGHSLSREAGVDAAPAPSAIGALEYAIAGPCIERGWRLGVDRQSRRIA